MKKINSVDRLSALPDPILHHIFSSLETIDIIDASLLSIRFRYLWKSTPFLNFELIRSNSMSTDLSSSEISDRSWYINFINRVFLYRDDFSSIQKLNIYSEFNLNRYQLKKWLLYALKRNVKKLHLQLCLNDIIELPSSLFTSQITEFTVDDYVPSGEAEDATIHLPSTICSASRITTLKLEHVKLPKGNASEEELVFSCSVLESLTFFSCDDTHLKTITISAPKLKILDFSNETFYKEVFKINICCPNLTSFTCFLVGYVDISFVDLVALVSACISISEKYVDKDLSAQPLVKILRGIYNVRALTLSSGNLEEIADSSRTLQMLPGLFRNLRIITLKDFAADGILSSTFAMGKLLKTLPSIQVVVWNRTWSEAGILTGKGEDQGQKLPDQSVFSCLETVKIIDPIGLEDEHELNFLGFLLKSAINLKELIVTTTQNRVQAEFCQKLLALPRSSSRVSIHCLC